MNRLLVTASTRGGSVVAAVSVAVVMMGVIACTGDRSSPSTGSGSVVTGSTQAGSTPTATGPVLCGPAPGQSVTDDGSGDFAPLPPGGRGRSGGPDLFSSGSSDELLRLYEAFAVLRVVSRGVPTAIADPHTFGARPSRQHPPPGGPDDFEVIRPTRFAVVRQLKGSIPIASISTCPAAPSIRSRPTGLLPRSASEIGCSPSSACTTTLDRPPRG